MRTWRVGRTCISKLQVLQVRKCGSPAHITRHLQEDAKQYRYPTVESFLHWVRARISVSFRRLDQPKVKLSASQCPSEPSASCLSHPQPFPRPFESVRVYKLWSSLWHAQVLQSDAMSPGRGLACCYLQRPGIHLSGGLRPTLISVMRQRSSCEAEGRHGPCAQEAGWTGRTTGARTRRGRSLV